MDLPRALGAGSGEAPVAVACSAPPEGHSRWTLQLLADQAVELELTDSISRETVRQTLKKTISSRGGRRSGASPR